MHQTLDRVANLLVLSLGLLAMTGADTVAAASDGKPNVIYILADDMGYGDPGCYGQEKIRTPNIDRLAAEGMSFTQHYAGSPVCAPSRYTLMTGKHTGHGTRRSNRPYVPLAEDEPTIGEIMQSAGYTTGMIGKWGLADTSGDYDPGTQGKPNDRGFDEWFGFLNQKHAWNYFPKFVWENGEKHTLNGERYIHDLFTDRALRFIRDNGGDDEPFCLFVWYTVPHVNNALGHTPYNLPIPCNAPYGDEDWPHIEKNYAAMLTRMDRDIGRMLDLLEERGIAEDTVVMFSSDNGAQSYEPHDKEFFDSTAGLRSYKGRVYEGGIRVPFVVRWPGVVEPGTTSDLPSAFWDILPTLAGIADVDPPKGIDGVSLLPTLRGNPERQKKHEYLYWEFPPRGYSRALRKGRWKAVIPKAGQPMELYDLEADEREQNDVADEHPERVAEFRELFDEARSPSEHWSLPEQ